MSPPGGLQAGDKNPNLNLFQLIKEMTTIFHIVRVHWSPYMHMQLSLTRPGNLRFFYEPPGPGGLVG